jgi:hypothetical protein
VEVGISPLHPPPPPCCQRGEAIDGLGGMFDDGGYHDVRARTMAERTRPVSETRCGCLG